MAILFLSFICAGCWTTEKQRWEQQRQEADQKEKAYRESLPTCAGAEWFNECEPIILADFKKVKVFIHGKEWNGGFEVKERKSTLDLVKTSIKGEMEKLGYEVDFGRTIADDEFDKEVYLCSISNKSANTLVKIKHNEPLFKKLINEDAGLNDYDVLLLLEYYIQDIGNQVKGTLVRVKYQLYDVGRDKMIFCSLQDSSDSKKMITGKSYEKKIGDKLYLATPYRFEGSDESVVRGAINKAFNYLPIRSAGTVKPQEFDILRKGNCKVISATLIWK